jgi:hypothetical protein
MGKAPVTGCVQQELMPAVVEMERKTWLLSCLESRRLTSNGLAGSEYPDTNVYAFGRIDGIGVLLKKMVVRTRIPDESTI